MNQLKLEISSFKKSSVFWRNYKSLLAEQPRNKFRQFLEDKQNIKHRDLEIGFPGRSTHLGLGRFFRSRLGLPKGRLGSVRSISDKKGRLFANHIPKYLNTG